MDSDQGGSRVNWLVYALGAVSIGLFGYSGLLWWRMRKGADPVRPNEFAMNAFRQERWMAAGLFSIGALFIMVWAAGMFSRF